MATNWFRIPDDPTVDGNQPQHLDDIDGIRRWWGNTVSDSPLYIAEVTGTDSALDTLESKSGVTKIIKSQARDAFASVSWVNERTLDNE